LGVNSQCSGTDQDILHSWVGIARRLNAEKPGPLLSAQSGNFSVTLASGRGRRLAFPGHRCGRFVEIEKRPARTWRKKMKTETINAQANRQEKFKLGRVMATPAAMGALGANEILRALARHAAGDWGDVDREDSRANDRALQAGGRLLSAYRGERNTKFWIITEADRAATTVLLPEDY
jgi:hypothetical protein